jgi:hypothetical protein
MKLFAGENRIRKEILMKSVKWLSVLSAFLFSMSLNPAFAGDACNKAFDKLDADKNNVLTYDEFSKFEHLRKIPFADMKEFDKNKDGIVLFDEACRGMFDKSDKNHDSKIDRKEWEEFYNSIVQR